MPSMEPPAEAGRPRKARWTHDILRLDRSFLSPSTRREQVHGPVQFLHALAFAQVGMPRMASCLSAKFGQLPPRAEHTIGSRVVAASQIGQGQHDACRSRGWSRHANGAFRTRGLAPTETCACGSSLRGSPLTIRPDGEEDGAKIALRVSRDYTPVMVDGWHSCARAAQSGCRD